MTISVSNIYSFLLKEGNVTVKPAHLRFRTDSSIVGGYVSWKRKPFSLISQKRKKKLAEFQT